MNKFIGIGRLTGDPDIRMYGETNEKKAARYCMAFDRFGKKEEGQQTADFINCVAYGKAADFADQYLRKGMKIGITGRLQSGKYTNKEGQTIYTTDILIESQEFCESKGSASGQTQQQDQTAPPQQTATTSAPQPAQAAPAQQQADMGFINIPDGIAAELPFN
jgi:single-strand DNA-binding protein